MRGLAKGMGVSTGTLYHYFETKDAIFEQAVYHLANRHVQAVLGIIPPEADLNTKLTLISDWINNEQRNLQRSLLLILDFARHKSDDKALELVRSSSNHYRDTLIGALGNHPGIWPMMVGILVAALLEGEEIRNPSIFLAPLIASSGHIGV